MYKMRNRINAAMMRAYIHTVTATREFVSTARQKLREKDGSFLTDHALAIVITVVAASIVILAVVTLLRNKIFPNLNNSVDDFFNMI